MNHHQLFMTGIILLISGLFIRIRIGRRRLHRRTPTGLQLFRSYDESVVTRVGEGCAGVIGALLLLAGVLLTLAGLA